MKTIKKLAIAAAIGMATLSSQAAQTLTDLNGGTNNVPGSTTKAYAYLPINLFVMRQSVQLGVQVSFKLLSAGTDPVVVQFSSSLDNSQWVTNSAQVTLSGNGTATVATNVNINTGGIPFWRVESVQNVNAAAITNLNVTGWTKVGVRGQP